MFKRIALGAAVLGLVACARTGRAPESPREVVVASAAPLQSPPSPQVERPEERALALERQRSTRADDEIARDVNEALRRSRRFSDLEVRVNDRVVEISGTVASLADAADAAAASYRVAGVYAVTSRIGVLGPAEATDAALERRVLARLASLPGVSATHVTPSAHHGGAARCCVWGCRGAPRVGGRLASARRGVRAERARVRCRLPGAWALGL